ncbi:MAG: hypothetical protein K8R60_06840 [Burkholderiales bacterium]|nr:hypothetical protein [Burkholderiales bacterium]
MWILFARSPRPDAAYWPGRRFLAGVDALVWPGLWLAAALCGPFDTGSVGTVAGVGLVASALSRLRCALLRNERYRFTTWRWGIWLSVAVAVGLFAKLAAT